MLSRCLEMAACRYDGAGIRSPVVRELARHVEFVAVCPEVGIGLGVPRAPIRIERSRSPEGSGETELRLVQPSTGLDLTARMAGFSDSFADEAGPVDGLLLKSRSPSCGLGDVKIWDGEAVAARQGWGMFASVMRARFPGVPMEDEERLLDEDVRDRWLARVFASARARAASGARRAPG